jgi:hypothetical protein
MTGVLLRRCPLWTVTFKAVLLSLGAAICLLTDRIPLPAVQRCVKPDDHLAWLGVHLQLLRNDPGCGPGQYALNGAPGHATGLVVMVAIPTLLANLATVLAAVGVWAALRTALVRAAAVLGRLWPSLPAPDSAPAAQLAAPPAAWAPGRLLRAWQLDRSPVRRRGPPAPRLV